MSPPSPLNILVLGSGGREHALVKACLASPLAARVIAAPGNGGIAAEVPCHPLDPTDPAAVTALARELGAGLVLIGPEVPLSRGVADSLRAAGIPAFGPGRDAARLESSKAFCKAFLQRHAIPTAAFGTFHDLPSALAFLDTQSYPVVVKASGLAAGKGVIIAPDQPAAAAAAAAMLDGSLFGDSGREIVIESFLEGEEVSVHALVSGNSWLLLPSSQDHKRVGEGDTGLNTGGMGAYAPADVFTPALRDTVVQTILEPTLAGLAAEGLDYRGVLYIGLMVTPEGPRVLEFNVRFGDPETQVILPLVADDLVELFLLCAHGEKLPPTLHLHPASALIVVLASRGYPEAYPTGETITLPPPVQRGGALLHAGTRLAPDGSILTAGGRVLGAVGTGPNLRLAALQAYGLAEAVTFPSRYFRRDIGWRQLQARRR